MRNRRQKGERERYYRGPSGASFGALDLLGVLDLFTDLRILDLRSCHRPPLLLNVGKRGKVGEGGGG
jgi:hypothetical protein